MKRESSRSSEKRKTEFEDDGRTLYDMSGLDDMHRTGPRRENKEGIKVTRAERRALIRAAFRHYAPIFFGVLVCFTLAALLIYFWLR
ncbi:MAG: hypothetical protein K2N23_04955 [Clostridia bacterium]|nr:hypothetical protein [Clostridia bacterium]